MDRRTFLKASAAAGGAMLLPHGAFAAGEVETSKLSLGFGLDPVFAPHILAMKKGWFEEAGFTEISTKSFTGGALAGEALLSGDIQLWTPGNVPPISMAHTGIPVVLLGTNCLATAAENLVARTDAGIKAPEDLYGKKIGLLAGSTASADLANLVSHYGLDGSKIEVVNMPPPEQLAALNAGEIDALLCWQPWGYKALELGNTELIHSGTTSHFAANDGEKVALSATRSVFVMSADFVKKNPNATFAITAALVRGQRYAADPANHDEVMGLVAEETKQDRSLVEAIWDQYVFDPTFDQAYVDDMTKMTDFLIEAGRVTADPIDPLDYTYTAPAEAAGVTVEIPGKWQP